MAIWISQCEINVPQALCIITSSWKCSWQSISWWYKEARWLDIKKTNNQMRPSRVLGQGWRHSSLLPDTLIVQLFSGRNRAIWCRLVSSGVVWCNLAQLNRYVSYYFPLEGRMGIISYCPWMIWGDIVAMRFPKKITYEIYLFDSYIQFTHNYTHIKLVR